MLSPKLCVTGIFLCGCWSPNPTQTALVSTLWVFLRCLCRFTLIPSCSGASQTKSLYGLPFACDTFSGAEGFGVSMVCEVEKITLPLPPVSAYFGFVLGCFVLANSHSAHCVVLLHECSAAADQRPGSDPGEALFCWKQHSRTHFSQTASSFSPVLCQKIRAGIMDC